MPALLDFSIPLTDTLSYPVYRLFITGVCLVSRRLDVLRDSSNSNRHDDSRRQQQPRDGRISRRQYATAVRLGFCRRHVRSPPFAGAIAAPISSVFPGMGNQILIICFVVVVIGGIGSINGAMIASLAIGLADTLGKVIAAEYSAIAVYLVMAHHSFVAAPGHRQQSVIPPCPIHSPAHRADRRRCSRLALFPLIGATFLYSARRQNHDHGDFRA